MKTTDIDEQTGLVDTLTACYSSGRRLYYELEDRRDPAAKEVKKRIDELDLQIEGLLQNLYGAWAGNARTLTKQVSDLNQDLRKAIKEVEENVKTARNVSKALGYLAKAVRLASRLLKVSGGLR